QDHQQRDRLPPGLELLGHFQRDAASEGIAPQVVGAFRLTISDRIDVLAGHVLNARAAKFSPLQRGRLNSVEELVWSQVACQVLEAEYGATGTVNTEEGGPCSQGLQWYQAGPCSRTASLIEKLDQLLDRGRLVQDRQGQLLTEGLLSR